MCQCRPICYTTNADRPNTVKTTIEEAAEPVEALAFEAAVGGSDVGEATGAAIG